MSTPESTLPVGGETGIEARGIERVLPHERTHVSIIDNFTMWLSANMVISTVALGAIAIPVFGLGFWDSLAAIVLFNVLGALPVAYFSTLGPRLGLRQMTIARFSFGWYGAKIMALFNVAACIGWSAVNVIVGSQIITALSHGQVPVWLSIVVIAALTTVVSVYGYRYVHRYERYAWMPMAVIFLIVLAVTAGRMEVVPTSAWTMAHIASWVSFGGAIFGVRHRLEFLCRGLHREPARAHAARTHLLAHLLRRDRAVHPAGNPGRGAHHDQRLRQGRQ